MTYARRRLPLLLPIAVLVFAGEPVTAGGSPRADNEGAHRDAASAAAAGSRQVFRYRATVTALTRSKVYYPSDAAAGGRVVEKRWVMKFPNFRVVVMRLRGAPLTVSLPRNSARGTVFTAFDYKDNERTGPDDQRPACEIGGEYPNLAAELNITGVAAKGRLPGYVDFRADHAQGGLLLNRSRDAANFACPQREPGSPLGYGTDMGPIRIRGATLEGHGNPPVTSLRRDWRSPAVRAPLAALIRGRNVHYETGLRTLTLVNGKPSTLAACPDPGEPCSSEELTRRLEISLRRRR